MPLVRRTRATFRRAEFGFFGVVAYTRVHTPRFWGLPLSAGALDFLRTLRRPWRTSWLIVGIWRLTPGNVSQPTSRVGCAEHSRLWGRGRPVKLRRGSDPR